MRSVISQFPVQFAGCVII